MYLLFASSNFHPPPPTRLVSHLYQHRVERRAQHGKDFTPYIYLPTYHGNLKIPKKKKRGQAWWEVRHIIKKRSQSGHWPLMYKLEEYIHMYIDKEKSSSVQQRKRLAHIDPDGYTYCALSKKAKGGECCILKWRERCLFSFLFFSFRFFSFLHGYIGFFFFG